MLRYLVRRFLKLIPVFFLANFLVFAVVRIIPGDPIQAQFGERSVPENLRQAYVDRYHLNESIPGQYAYYMRDLLSLDLGDSVTNQQPVWAIIRESIPRTATLAVMAVLFSALFSVPLGVFTAQHKDSLLDNGVLLIGLVLVASPVFVLGLGAQLLFTLTFPIFPVSGVEDGLLSYVLPALVISAGMLATNTRLMRSTVLETLGEEYLRTARAKGLSERRVIDVHALRNAIVPVITMFAIDFGHLLGGTIIVESVFNIPGIGFRMTRAVGQRDFTVITGVSALLVVAYLVINLLVDLLYAWLDPRIRLE